MKCIYYLGFTFLALTVLCCKKQPEPELVAEKAIPREWKPEDTRSIQGNRAPRGLILNTGEAAPGYVLFNPANSTETFLIDREGMVVHRWKGELSTLTSSYLLNNGHLVRLERDEDFPTFAAGGAAGRIREYDWDGNLLWDYEMANEKELVHHDIEIMPNGNVLAIAYEVKSAEEAIAAGMNPRHVSKAGIWPDKIIEIKPTKPFGGEIVWEWHMWDHLVQEFDPSGTNYGSVAGNPRRFDLNTRITHDFPPLSQEQVDEIIKMGMFTTNFTADNIFSEITHGNAISYNAEKDQIAVSFKYFNEIYIIDHSTTTQEAKGNTGGRWGHGGDLLYRWGNPQNYGRGTEEDHVLFNQHDVKFIPEGHPGAGNLLVFNNDIPGPDNKYPNLIAAMLAARSPDPEIAISDIANYSAVYEIELPTEEDGSYALPEKEAFGPSTPVWSYMAPDKYSLYSSVMSGAYRMKNGNTLVLTSFNGRMIEVTPEKEIVWEYWNPFNFEYRLPDGTAANPGNIPFQVFRATHFEPGHPALKGKTLDPLDPQPEPFIFKMPPAPATNGE